MTIKPEAILVKEGIYRFYANLESKDIGLFESLWPIPHGVSLNAYIVMGEKNALIDMVCDWDGTKIDIQNNLEHSGFSIQDIDYIVINHMEPDHSGWLPDVFEKNPRIRIITNRKAIDLIKSFYHIHDESAFIEVKDGDTFDLGAGKMLHFAFIPNVHWPETMATYESSQKVLFSCDAFGSYGRIEDKIFDDQCSAEDLHFYKREALRYYANIVASFSAFVIKAIEKVVALKIPIDVIAPAHGLIWRKNPMEIVTYYQQLASYTQGPGEKKVCVVWSSMYGNTQRVLPHILQGIESQGIPYEVFHLPYDHYGFAMSSAFESQGLVIGAPTYEYALFPPTAHFLDILKRKHIHGKDFFRFGSFGWSGGAQKELDALLVDKKGQDLFNTLEALEWQGRATAEVEKEAFSRGAELARLVEKNGRN